MRSELLQFFSWLAHFFVQKNEDGYQHHIDRRPIVLLQVDACGRDLDPQAQSASPVLWAIAPLPLVRWLQSVVLLAPPWSTPAFVASSYTRHGEKRNKRFTKMDDFRSSQSVFDLKPD